MEEKKEILKEQIISTIKEKSLLKQAVYDQTRYAFKLLKKVIQEIVNEYNSELRNDDGRVLLEFRDRGVFEVELKVAGDLIVFNMHSNVFEFPRNHEIWKESYYVERPLVTYSGIISMYNFLADSFKYNRLDDLGYLIGRMFINKDASFFIEGRRELGFNYPVFDKNIVNEENLKTLIESAINYVLKFDLLVPPYEQVKIVTVDQMKEKINKSKIQTGKRLGFQYNAIEK
ncbi:hypothetical protein LJC11_03970 [Bacteroidales bacterium OttesenSCG-928-I21]|nr:hypothetical protein [Bacteroidales bacterium OttesenSCG-928-I21]